MTVDVMAAFRSTGARQHAEMLHGIEMTPVSASFEWRHFVDHSALFTYSFRRHHGIVSAKQKNVVRFPSIYPKFISRANLLAPR